MRKSKVVAVVPALNEEEGIGKVIESMPNPVVSDILVVNGNSTDRTSEIAEEKGAIVVEEHRKGYGRAYKAGFENLPKDTDIVVCLDADCTYPSDKIEELVDTLNRENIDFISCSRMIDGNMSLKHKVGNKVLNTFTNSLFGLNMKKTIGLLISLLSLFLLVVNVSANALTYIATPSSVESNKPVTLTITAENTGPTNFINTYVVTYLPASLVVTSSSLPVYYQYTNPSIGMYGFLIGDIAPNQTKTVEITATANATAGTVLDTVAFLFEPIANGTRQISNTSVPVYVISPYVMPSFSMGNPNSACVENWTCAEWSSCVNGRQSRTCSDSNNCNTSTSKPAEYQDCPIVATTAPSVTINPSELSGITGMISVAITSPAFLALLALIVVIAILIAVFRPKNVEKMEEKPPANEAMPGNEATSENEVIPGNEPTPDDGTIPGNEPTPENDEGSQNIG